MTDLHDEATIEPLWPLREIEVVGLFGGTKPIRLELDPTATILTGENGSGKSTILQAVRHVGLSQWPGLERLPLDGLALRFANGYEVTVTRAEQGVVLRNASGDTWRPPKSARRAAYRRHPRLLRLRHEMDLAASTDELARLQHEYDRLLSRVADVEDIEDGELPDWVQQLELGFETKLISARRLEHRLRPDQARPGEERPQSVVDRFAEELAERMRQQLSQYAGESRRQERSLPSQIVTAMQQAPLPDSETLATEVDALGTEVRSVGASLTRVGLLQGEDPEQRFADYPRDNANILLAIREVYRVTLQRLERLTALRAELELFADFLGERLTGKHIELNPRNGIDIVLPHEQRIRPSQLSSGEQQLLALGYELLFGTQPHSVVLLDEPELSLHVAWLQGLLSSFLEIGSTRRLQFVVATHSPSVLAGFAERERSLDALSS